MSEKMSKDSWIAFWALVVSLFSVFLSCYQDTQQGKQIEEAFRLAKEFSDREAQRLEDDVLLKKSSVTLIWNPKSKKLDWAEKNSALEFLNAGTETVESVDVWWSFDPRDLSVEAMNGFVSEYKESLVPNAAVSKETLRQVNAPPQLEHLLADDNAPKEMFGTIRIEGVDRNNNAFSTQYTFEATISRRNPNPEIRVDFGKPVDVDWTKQGIFK
jgi:hypothetical protein